MGGEPASPALRHLERPGKGIIRTCLDLAVQIRRVNTFPLLNKRSFELHVELTQTLLRILFSCFLHCI